MLWAFCLERLSINFQQPEVPRRPILQIRKLGLGGSNGLEAPRPMEDGFEPESICPGASVVGPSSHTAPEKTFPDAGRILMDPTGCVLPDPKNTASLKT